MFGSVQLAARIEGSGVALGARAAKACGGFVVACGRGAGMFAGAGSPLSKGLGIGFDDALDLDALAEIERRFAEHDAPLMVELATLAPQPVAEALTRRGYVVLGFEDVLGRSLADPVPPPTRSADATLARSGDEELDMWIDVMVTGFAALDTEGVPTHETFADDTLRRAMAQTVPAHERWLARRDGVPVAAASLQIADGVAWMSGSATLPAHRRQGLQTALYAARLQSARAQGADVATVTVSPGSPSSRNAQQQGFRLLYTRAILQAPTPRDAG